MAEMVYADAKLILSIPDAMDAQLSPLFTDLLKWIREYLNTETVPEANNFVVLQMFKPAALNSVNGITTGEIKSQSVEGNSVTYSNSESLASVIQSTFQSLKVNLQGRKLKWRHSDSSE